MTTSSSFRRNTAALSDARLFREACYVDDLYVTKGDFEHYATVLDEFWRWFLSQTGVESETIEG